MDAIELIRRLHYHRNWANRRLLSAAETLEEEQLRQPFPIGQGSIWRSLVHLYAAEFVWLEALQGNESPLLPGDAPGQLPGNQQGEGGVASLDELRAGWSELQSRWERYLAELTPDRLNQLVYKVSTSSAAGQRTGVPCSDILLHVCTHAQYTTAQVINMLRHAGAQNLPDAMLISLARSEGS